MTDFPGALCAQQGVIDPVGTVHPESGETRGPAERCELGESSQGADERGDPSAAQPAGGAGQRWRAEGQPDADRGADPRGRADRHAGAVTGAMLGPLTSKGCTNQLDRT